MTTKILQGDVRDVLKTLPSDYFDMVLTSPPYWGLRSYLPEGHPDKEKEIGLEPTMQEYLDTMVCVCRELRRVLKPEGTFWLNIGDSYNNVDKWGGGGANTGKHRREPDGDPASWKAVRRKWGKQPGIKPKDLCLIPNRLAILLQEDGWYVRSEIIWHKPNPMPESVTDRPTCAHEKVWLLTKSARYFYDAMAIREPLAASSISRLAQPTLESQAGSSRANGGAKTNGAMKAVKFGGNKGRGDHGYAARTSGNEWYPGPGANARNVWSIATQSFSGAHFATMPPALAERCIKAGCPEGGTVLDPFGGAGTTGLVAGRLGRHATLIELNPQYRELAIDRLRSDYPLFAEVAE